MRKKTCQVKSFRRKERLLVMVTGCIGVEHFVVMHHGIAHWVVAPLICLLATVIFY
jgi:hypothetical protein